MQSAAMLPKLAETTQTITFSEDEDSNVTAEVYAANIIVSSNAGAHSHGSSRVKLKSLVDYNWEPRFYPGQLLAVHLSGKFLAYCIKAPNPTSPGTWHGMVRVVYNPEPGTDRRALIKGMKGEVQDLAFAHISNQVLLACIDEQGNFYVHEIEVTDSGLRCTLISEVRAEAVASPLSGGVHRVVWCPYIPDEDDDSSDDEEVKLLLTTHGSIARMWNVSSLGVSGCVSQGVVAGREHAAPIVDAAFSPDGTALATASADGYVMFFKVYTAGEGSARCLHKWQPHGGKPLSCLFFLDNHKHLNSDVQFWKFAVTGAESNTVIKLWSCKSWVCQQTITFGPGLPAEPSSFGLKAMLDTSASYLLLSDFSSRSLYVLSIAHDAADTLAYCKSVSQFLLPYPVLSFCIVDAEEEQAKCESGCDDPFHRNGSAAGVGDSPDDFDQDEALAEARAEANAMAAGEVRVKLRLFIVQPKGLQEGELTYIMPHTPTLNATADLLHGLSEVSLEGRPVSPAPAELAPAPAPAPAPAATDLPQLNLMTPDAFSSPGKRDDDDPPLPATPDINNTRTSNSVCEEIRSGVCVEGKPTSGGSSPSREVRDIMAHNDPDFLNHMEDEEPTGSLADEVVVCEEEGEGEELNGELRPGDVFPRTDRAHVHVHTHTPTDTLAMPATETTWPQISIAQITEANQRKATSDKSSALAHSHNNSLNVSATASAGGQSAASADEVRVSGLSAADKARLEELEHKLDKLCELVSGTSREVRSLRVEGGPRALIDEALHQHARRTAAALETALNDGWERIARVGETASARAASAAGVGAARALEPLANALHHELAAKLSATDHLLRDNIDKLATNKTVMERLSTSIAKSLSDMVRESFRAALVESVVPAMEKAHAQIFRQINHAFQAGTKEFATHTEAMARAAAERGGASAASALTAALDRHTEALNKAAPPHAVLAQTLKEVAHSVLEKELQWWRAEARGAVCAVAGSRAHSPHGTPSHASAVDRQRSRNVARNCVQESLPFLLQMQVAQIQSLMSGGDMNGAFQLALSASDLQLVVAACRAAEPARVFAPPCKLKQHVLLSLVQQLAADMTTDTLLKHRYLEEAVMNLDPSNPVTREHLPVVIRELQKQIVAFLNANPGHALTRQFKMLLMATDSLIKTSV